MFTSLFSKKICESENFEKRISPRRISFRYEKKPFELVLNTFDEDINREVLMVYVHNEINQKNINTHLLKAIFKDNLLSQFANSNFQFYPILSSEKSLSKISQYFSMREAPCLIFLRWGMDRGLSCMGIQPLKMNSTPDSVNEAMNDVLERVDDEKKRERQIEGEIDRKEASKKLTEKEHQRQRDQMMSGGNSAPDVQGLNRF